MKGLIDYYIVSLDKIERQIRKDSDKKAMFFNENLKFEEESDESIEYSIHRVLENLD